MILRHVALTCSSENNADGFFKNLLGLEKSEPKTCLKKIIQLLLFRLDRL
jgi:hypothetical protein